MFVRNIFTTSITGRENRGLSPQYYAELVHLRYKTYVHCKAGRGRSASTVMCYLIFRYNMSVPWAQVILKNLRFEVPFQRLLFEGDCLMTVGAYLNEFV